MLCGSLRMERLKIFANLRDQTKRNNRIDKNQNDIQIILSIFRQPVSGVSSPSSGDTLRFVQQLVLTVPFR